MRSSRLDYVLWAIFALWWPTAAYSVPRKFLIVSNGLNGSLYYAVVRGQGGKVEMKVLVPPNKGLEHPQGLAVDQRRQLLYVADSGLMGIVAYQIQSSGDSLFVTDSKPVAGGFEARSVAVDGQGHIYYTDEVSGKVFMLPPSDFASINPNASGKVIFAQASSGAVSAPGGVAADNFFVYWTNKLSGSTAGSVVRGLGAEQGALPTALSKNIAKAYGVCLAINQLYYTDSEDNVWAGSKAGGQAPVLVSSNFSAPRGCVWDGLNTLYIADRALGGVYSMRAPMVSLQQTVVTKVADVDEAFAVTIFSCSSRIGLSIASLLVAIASLM